MDSLVVSNDSNGNFVKPHFIEELGCEGITSQEIASSVGVRKDALHRLIDDLVTSGDLSSPQIVNFNNINGVRVEVYLFNIDDAKFLVTESSTPKGRAYCRFLIECEKAAASLSELSPMLQMFIQLERSQNLTQKRLVLVEQAVAEKAEAANECLSSEQVQELERMFAQIYKKNKDGPLIGRIKRTLKSRFLKCAVSGVTYKNIAQRDYPAMVTLVKEMGGMN